MIHYSLTFPNPLTHIIGIQMTIDVEGQKSELSIPAWRPGRYELTDYAANISNFRAYDSDRLVELDWVKSSPNSWQVSHDCGINKICLSYDYYAFQMDAGNSLVDDEQVYINFINCLLYQKDQMFDEHSVSIQLPNDYRIACALRIKNDETLIVKDYYTLVDSPLLACKELVTWQYEINDTHFFIHINGEVPLEKEELLSNFRSFSYQQIKEMKIFPCQHYHFIIQSLPYRHYHGVEHGDSTVLVLGPNQAEHKKSYFDQLMGVASHELFHAWNVTRIRCKEHSPYDFGNAVLFDTGGIAEGFTTYFGDLFLVKSGVITEQEYFDEVDKLISRHFENQARFSMSLLDSSLNLWTNGYKKGAQFEKVSIYVKGAIVALLLDLAIRKNTSHKKNLLTVAREMYAQYTASNGGYELVDIYQLLYDIGGDDVLNLARKHWEGRGDVCEDLNDVLSYVGVQLEKVPHPDMLTSSLGMKLVDGRVTEIARESPCSDLFSVGDIVHSVNGIQLDEVSDLDKDLMFEIERNNLLKTIAYILDGNDYFSSYKLRDTPQLSSETVEQRVKWLGN